MIKWDYKKIQRPDITMLKRDNILALVCREFEVTPNDVKRGKGERSVQNATNARSLYCYFTRTLLRDTYMRIALDLNVGHATVIYHIRKVEDCIEYNDPLVFNIERIKKQLNP